MVMLPQTFNTADVPEDEFTPLPAGTYEAMIIESTMKPTKDKTGQFLELQEQILGPTNKGRILYVRLNLDNKTQKAVEIAYKELAKICSAVGKPSIRDSNELHNIRHMINVEVEPGKPYMKDNVEKQGSPQNIIKSYMPWGTATAEQQGAGASASSSTQAASVPNTNLPPWKR